MSAAHCFLGVAPEIAVAVVGIVNRTDPTGVAYDIERLISHPLYVRNLMPFYTSNFDE